MAGQPALRALAAPSQPRGLSGSQLGVLGGKRPSEAAGCGRALPFPLRLPATRGHRESCAPCPSTSAPLRCPGRVGVGTGGAEQTLCLFPEGGSSAPRVRTGIQGALCCRGLQQPGREAASEWKLCVGGLGWPACCSGAPGRRGSKGGKGGDHRGTAFLLGAGTEPSSRF